MSFIHRNIAAIFIFVLVAALGWIYGGTMSSVIRPVLPWLIAIMYEVALCFPRDAMASRRAMHGSAFGGRFARIH